MTNMRVAVQGFTVPLLIAVSLHLLPVVAFAQLAGYSTQLSLDAPVQAGDSVTITGTGAPEGEGIWVELWRVPAGSSRAEPLQSVPADGFGDYSFEGVSVAEGDQLFVTLSRSWQFETDGDAEGWDGGVNDAALQVVDGILSLEINDLTGDGFRDCFFSNSFAYDPVYYRVVEIRLRNPAPIYPGGNPDAPFSWLGIFWGAPWGTTINEHNAQVGAEMAEFETFLIPMGKDETIIVPGPVADSLPDRDSLATAYIQIEASFDHRRGGFGGAPKFPQQPVLEFLLRAAGQPGRDCPPAPAR